MSGIPLVGNQGPTTRNLLRARWQKGSLGTEIPQRCSVAERRWVGAWGEAPEPFQGRDNSRK